MWNQCSCMSNLKVCNINVLQCDLAAAICQASMFLLLLVILCGGIPPVLGDTAFSFPSDTDSQALLLSDEALVVNNTLLLNSIAASSNPGIASKARAFYPTPVELYDNVTKRFASFYTKATLSILTGQDNCWGADGMAFVIFSASSPSVSEADSGGYLGILNGSNNGQPSNQIMAVEIDTWQNPEFNDPSSCHMAVLTNSLTHDPAANVSDFCKNQNSSWCLDNCIQFTTLHEFVLQVLYDGVYLHGSLTSVNTGIVWFDITQKLDLSTVFTTNELYVGFSGSTHDSCAETHKIHSWSFIATSPSVSSPGQSPLASPPLPQVIGSIPPQAAAGSADMKGSKPSDGDLKHVQAVGAIVGAVCTLLALLAVGGAVYLTRRCLKRGSGEDCSRLVSKQHSLKDSDMLPELELPVGVSLHGLRRFTYQELRSATNKFAPEEILGRGGFGWVYKGKLVDTGALVAVKMISPEKFQHGGEKEFLSEVSIISRVHHRNLVKLQGCCYDRSNMLLVYDYMENGSLDKLLVRKKPSIIISTEELSISNDSSAIISKKDHLTWDVRFKIVNAIAGALSYLHEECGQCILHRDVKPSNVLLDSEFNAYLADFGLARLFDHDKMAPTMTCGGTPGYIAPEIFQSGRFTTKSDVYSFGILALEVACGRRPIEPELSASEVILLDWVWAAHESDDLLRVVDPCLGFEYDESEMKRLLQVGLLCCIVDPEGRVSMMAARNMLVGTKPITELPETKPEVHYRTRRKGDPKPFNIQGIPSSTGSSSSGTSNSIYSLSQSDGITERLKPR
jgi:serine/threonine protein kinase